MTKKKKLCKEVVKCNKQDISLLAQDVKYGIIHYDQVLVAHASIFLCFNVHLLLSRYVTLVVLLASVLTFLVHGVGNEIKCPATTLECWGRRTWSWSSRPGYLTSHGRRIFNFGIPRAHDASVDIMCTFQISNKLKTLYFIYFDDEFFFSFQILFFDALQCEESWESS